MARASRLASVALLLAGGFIHYRLWRHGYRGIPYIGPLFLANVISSALIALGLLIFRRSTTVMLGGAALSAGSLVALVMSRTTGILGFTDGSWTHDAYGAIAAELGAVVSLAVLAAATGRRRPLLPAESPPSRLQHPPSQG